MSFGRTFLLFAVLFSLPLLFTGVSRAQGPAAPPPASVAVSKAVTDTIAPEAEFIGTIHYPKVSRVASEVSGRVEVINFEAGQRVSMGEILVTLDSELLDKRIQAAEASHEEILSELEMKRLEFRRMDNLHKKHLIEEQVWDEARLTVKSLEKKAKAMLAEAERLRVERGKKTVGCPYDGVVLEKHTETGEWLSPGGPVATIASDAIVDIMVNVPEKTALAVRPGTKVRVRAAGKLYEGTVFALVRLGDAATRTFPVKIRIDNDGLLVAGMEAVVTLPSGEAFQALLVPRDALLNVSGRTVVAVVAEGRAKLIPVTVLGYKGASAAVEGQGLGEGIDVVVKGNERLREGQPVVVIQP